MGDVSTSGCNNGSVVETDAVVFMTVEVDVEDNKGMDCMKDDGINECKTPSAELDDDNAIVVEEFIAIAEKVI